jgi:Glyoxalase-like domain
VPTGGGQPADGRTRGDRLTGHHRRSDRLVRGPHLAESTDMPDDHHTAAGHQPDERDQTRTGRANRRIRRRGQVDAAVAGQPPGQRRFEPAGHPERWFHRRGPSDWLSGSGRDGGDDQRAENTEQRRGVVAHSRRRAVLTGGHADDRAGRAGDRGVALAELWTPPAAAITVWMTSPHRKVNIVTTRLDCVVIDSSEPLALARFWSAATGWPIAMEEPDEVAVEPPAGDEGIALVFVPVPEPKTARNRIHLDVQSGSTDEQAETVERLCELGAVQVDMGDRAVPWTVLADPEGNELCVLDPRDEYRDTGPVAAIVMDAVAPTMLATFWSAATGWPVTHGGPHFSALRSATGRGPYLELLRTTDPKVVKNRLHLDVAPPAGGDQNAEVKRLLSLGAHFADIGQGDVPWVVLSDPEGNEFCVLAPR